VSIVATVLPSSGGSFLALAIVVTTNDFPAFELLRIVERFAVGLDQPPTLIQTATTIEF
jgi:hypothetical protein